MWSPPIHDPDEWVRAGRGSELQFFATDAEVRRWLDRLPEECGPYAVWGSLLVKGNRECEPVLFSYPLDRWAAALTDDKRAAPDQVFLHAAKLMPRLPVDQEAARRANEWASLNGLVLVQHGGMQSGQQRASRIAVTNKIISRTTGKVVSLKDRLGLFEALRKMIKRELRFTSVQVFKDGHEEEDSLQLMTAEAAELAAAGKFVRRPGRPIMRRG